jgi:hypothetical protein
MLTKNLIYKFFLQELVKWEDSKYSKRSKAQRKSLKNKALEKEEK